MDRPPLPPFSRETAAQKARLAEDAWNTRDPEKVALAYSPDSRWRNRAEFLNGRAEIVAFLKRKWAKELDYRLIKEVWAFDGNRIAVRFAYEWRDDSGHWFRSYGNENWEFDAHGLMQVRHASINDLPILDADRKYHWALGRRPDDHPGLTDLGTMTDSGTRVAAPQGLSSRRVKLAFATAIIADVSQLPVNLSFFSWGLATLGGTVPLEAIDAAIDVITALIVNRLLGFHWALLPTFALELVPGLDAAPTWTACVAFVTMRRRRRAA